MNFLKMAKQKENLTTTRTRLDTSIQKCIQNPGKYLRQRVLQKQLVLLLAKEYFCKALYLRTLTES